jgi:hypothetical protein
MAALAVHAKGLRHEELQLLLDAVIRESHDDRDFVRKAVNWALRQIDKRGTCVATGWPSTRPRGSWPMATGPSGVWLRTS